MHEPLRLGICVPFAPIKPWQLKGSKVVVDVGKRLSEMWKAREGAEGDLLFEFCSFARGMESMPLRDLRSVLHRRSDDPFPHLRGRGRESSRMESDLEEDEGLLEC